MHKLKHQQRAQAELCFFKNEGCSHEPNEKQTQSPCFCLCKRCHRDHQLSHYAAVVSVTFSCPSPFLQSGGCFIPFLQVTGWKREVLLSVAPNKVQNNHLSRTIYISRNEIQKSKFSASSNLTLLFFFMLSSFL